jgi:hypothetical protein
VAEISRSRVDALRSSRLSLGSASTVDPAKLDAYQRVIDSLDMGAQSAYRARLADGHTYDRIAAELGKSPEHARVLVSEVIGRLIHQVLRRSPAGTERLADLLGRDRVARGDPEGRDRAEMEPDEAEILKELLDLAHLDTLRTTRASDEGAAPLKSWGKFTNLEVIGVGGFGTVYKAFDPILRHHVALKLYHPHRSQRPVEELLGEARKLARVRHENVVVVHGAEEIDGRVGVWMELVEGRTLEDEIVHGPNLDADAAAEVGIAICRALEAVHAAAVVHGDIKPQNVVRSTTGRIVLMDFGAASFSDPAAAEPRAMRAGTPAYMAPELFDLREPTVQSDIYAVGVVLFYLATGKLPVQGRSIKEVGQALDDGRVLPPREARPDLPPDFVRVVETALARAPGKRQQSARQLAEELRRSQRRKPAAGRGVAQTAVRVAGLGGAAAAAVGVLGFISTRAFEVFVSVDRDLAGGVVEYLVVGRSLVVPLGIYALAMAVLLAALAAVRWVVLRAMGAGRAEARAWRAAARRDPRLAAAAVALGGAAGWIGITWSHADIFSALAALRHLPDPSLDLSALGPAGEEHHMAHTEYSVYLAVALSAVVWKWFPDWERRVADITTVQVMKWAAIAVIVVALAAAAVPHRVLWERFEVVEYRGQEYYVVAANGEELQLFSPRTSGRARWRVSRTDTEIVCLGESRKLFEERVRP